MLEKHQKRKILPFEYFFIPLFKTSNGQKSISFRGPKLWNQLSSDVKLAPSLATFKRRLKKEILDG